MAAMKIFILKADVKKPYEVYICTSDHERSCTSPAMMPTALRAKEISHTEASLSIPQDVPRSTRFRGKMPHPSSINARYAAPTWSLCHARL
jgi:hypothetical protein